MLCSPEETKMLFAGILSFHLFIIILDSMIEITIGNNGKYLLKKMNVIGNVAGKILQ